MYPHFKLFFFLLLFLNSSVGDGGFFSNNDFCIFFMQIIANRKKVLAQRQLSESKGKKILDFLDILLETKVSFDLNFLYPA